MTDAEIARVAAWLREHRTEINAAAQGGDRRKLVEGLARFLEKSTIASNDRLTNRA